MSIPQHSAPHIRNHPIVPVRPFVAGLFLTAVVCLGSAVAATEHSATVLGRVMSDTGEFLPSARVRIWVFPPDEGIDTRLPPTLETTTDHDGRYRATIELGAHKSRTVCVEATLPGFRSPEALGKFLRIWRQRTLTAGQSVGISLLLRPGLYVAGTVVDEAGKPVADADLVASLSCWPGDNDIARTDGQGRFELFEFPPGRPANKTACQGRIRVDHAGLLRTTIVDVYRLTPKELKKLRVVMPTGRVVSGSLIDDAGKPIVGAMVEALFSDTARRQAVLSDSHGRFQLTGLPAEATTIRAHSLDWSHKGSLELKLDRDHRELTFRLESVHKQPVRASYDLFGLIVANSTPELRARYDLPPGSGVIVLGRKADSIFDPEVREGDCLESVNTWVHTVRDLRELVAEMLGMAGQQDSQSGAMHRCEVAYRTRPLGGGNNDYRVAKLKLDQQSIENLEALLAKLRTQ